MLPEFLPSPQGEANRQRGAISSAAILATLRRFGPMQPSAIAERVGLTSRAVRLHLAQLRKQRLVRRRTTGRGLNLWRALETPR